MGIVDTQHFLFYVILYKLYDLCCSIGTTTTVRLLFFYETKETIATT